MALLAVAEEAGLVAEVSTKSNAAQLRGIEGHFNF